MKKKKRSVKTRLGILLFFLGLISFFLILLFAPFFNISSIEVVGANRYSPEKIKEVSGVLIGENAYRKLKFKAEAILGLRLLDSEDMIKQLPYVKTSRVSIVFPNKILVRITERQPAAYLNHLDNYLAVDNEGYVLETSNDKPMDGLKEIRGIEVAKYTIGGQLETKAISLIGKGIEIIENIRQSDTNTDFKLFEVLDWVDMVDSNKALISLDNRIIVRFNPEDKLRYTIDFTKEIFFKEINSKEKGRIEFSEGQNPTIIHE